MRRAASKKRITPPKKMCLVCSSPKQEAIPTQLPSERTALLCPPCGGDRFRIAEAERRLDAEEKDV